MSIIASLKTYWSGNSTLTAALPITKVFVDLIPERTAFPYARLHVLPGAPQYLTSGTHIETFNYQLSVFHTDLEALWTIVDAITGQLDQSYPTAATLIHTRKNRIPMTEVVNGVYTYSIILEYEWTYNA